MGVRETTPIQIHSHLPARPLAPLPLHVGCISDSIHSNIFQTQIMLKIHPVHYEKLNVLK